MDISRLALALENPDEEVRKEAVLTLTEVADTAAQGMLRRATADPSPAVRFFARRGLDRIQKQSPAAVNPAWERALEEAAGDNIDVDTWRRLLSEPDVEARLRNVMASLQVTDPALLPLLWSRLPQETDVRIRASLVKAIAKFRRADSFELLVPLLSDPDPRVRANAVEALDDLADLRLQPLLEPLLSDPDNRIRGNALKALSRFDRPRALSGAHAMASSPELWMRATAVWLYRELGGEQARDALLRMRSREDGEMAEKIDAAVALLEERRAGRDILPELASDSGVLDAIRTKLANADKNVRIQAVFQAGELPPAKAVPILKEALLSERHEHVIATLAKTLGQVGGVSQIGVVSEFLAHQDPRVRANAIEGLAAIGTEEALRKAEPLLADPNRRVRANAAWALHGRDPARAFATLKEMLLSKDSALQDSAIFALREIGTEQVVELFESALASDNPETQIKVLRVLESWSGRNPIAARLAEAFKERGRAMPWVSERMDELVKQFKAGKGKERLRALDKLATFQEGGARQLVEQASGTDDDPAVRKRARDLIKRSDFEQARLEAFFRLGLAAYQWIRDEKASVPRELSRLVGRAKQASKDLEGGRDVMSSLSLRRQTLVDLGRELHLLMVTGQVSAPPLEPLMREIERLEIRQEVADLPRPPSTEGRVWPRLAAGVVAGLLLGVGTYFLFKMPPSPNMKKLKIFEKKNEAAAPATPATTPTTPTTR